MKNAAAVVQCLVSINTNANGEVLIVFADEFLNLWGIKQDTICGNRNHVIITPWVLELEGFSLKVLDRLVDELNL